jgi:hypothetical protein
MQEIPCTRYDLLCEIPQWNKWTVDERGWPEDFWSEGERCTDGGVDGYLCGNCGADFIIDQGMRSLATDKAWQEALAHLPKQEAA